MKKILKHTKVKVFSINSAGSIGYQYKKKIYYAPVTKAIYKTNSRWITDSNFKGKTIVVIEENIQYMHGNGEVNIFKIELKRH